MARGKCVCPHGSHVGKQCAELNHTIAREVGVRRLSSRVRAQEPFKDIVPVLAHEVDLVQWDAKRPCHGLRVSKILLVPAGCARLFALVPVSCDDTDNVKTSALQRKRSYRGVYAS
jgi:hypothetical protein